MTKLEKLLEELKGYSNIHVVGTSGDEGAEIAAFLVKNGIPFTGHDFASNPSEYLRDIDQADLLFVPQSWYLYEANSPINNLSTPLKTVTQLHYQLFKDQMIGVTGSAGKSTVAAMIHHLIPGSILIGNDRNSGTILDKADEVPPDTWIVTETSNRQLMTLEDSPKIGVITNITPNHVNEHHSLCEYKKIKLKLISSSEHKIVNENLELDQKDIITFTGKNHIEANQNAALAVAEIVGTPGNLENFEPLKQRLELIHETDGLTFYDDRQGTAVDSTIQALHTLEPPITLIFGGANKDMPIEELAKTINEFCELAIGIESPFTSEIAPLLDDLIIVKTMTEAVEEAKKSERPSSVLFSPACEYGPYFAPLKGHEDYLDFPKLCK